MTVYDLLEAISCADDELLLRSEVKQSRKPWVRYVSLAACAVLVVAAAFVFIRSNVRLTVSPDVTTSPSDTDITVTTPADTDNETTTTKPDPEVTTTPDTSQGVSSSNEVVTTSKDPTAIVNPGTEILNPDEAPPPFARSGGDENAWYYEALIPKIGHISSTFAGLFDQDEFNKWRDSVNVLYRKGEDVPTDINGFLNVYAMMNYFDLSDEDVTKAFEYELSQDDEPDYMNETDLQILLSRDEAAILSHFKSDASIVIGDRIYSPQWVYENSLRAYRDAGITPEMLKEKLAIYNQFNFTDEARNYLINKINQYESSLSPAVGGSDSMFNRKYIDEVYNIHIATLLVDKDVRDRWVNDVFLNKTPFEQEALPPLYQIINELGIPKEDFVKKNNEYADSPDSYLAQYIVDALYADDIETMKQILMSPYALYHNNEIYTFDELVANPELAKDIPKDTLAKYFDNIEFICIENGEIKYMQETIDNARRSCGLDEYSDDLALSELFYTFKDKLKSDLENIGNLNNKPEIDVNISFGGFGYQGIMAYDISEYVGDQAWDKTKEISYLPIYKNLAYTKYSSSGIATYLSEKELLSIAWDIANKLGTTVRYYNCEYLNPMAFEPDSGYTGDEILRLTATTPKHIITITGGGQVSIEFIEPVPLPDSYSLAYSQKDSDNAIRTIEYLCEEYSALLGYTEAGYYSPIDYNIYGEIHRTYSAYDASGETDTEAILSRNFFANTFAAGDEDGTALKYIRMNGYKLLSAEIMGSYPTISYNEAKQMLIDGKYLTTVPNEYLNQGRVLEEDISECMLEYRFEASDSVYMPYYVFYVFLGNANGKRPEGINTYGVYYVPAISLEYYSEQPEWGGQFGYSEENADKLYADDED